MLLTVQEEAGSGAGRRETGSRLGLWESVAGRVGRTLGISILPTPLASSGLIKEAWPILGPASGLLSRLGPLSHTTCMVQRSSLNAIHM